MFGGESSPSSSIIEIETSDTFPAASLADAKRRTLIDIVMETSQGVRRNESCAMSFGS